MLYVLVCLGCGQGHMQQLKATCLKNTFAGRCGGQGEVVGGVGEHQGAYTPALVRDPGPDPTTSACLAHCLHLHHHLPPRRLALPHHSPCLKLSVAMPNHPS